MTYIWFLDCCNACVTKVKLSKERDEELNTFLESGGDMYDWISKYEDDFGINLNSSSWMITEDDNVYDVDF